MFTSTVFGDYKISTGADNNSTINKITAPIDTGAESFYDKNSVYKLPDTVSDDQTISLIVETGAESVIDSYHESGSALSLEEYATTSQARGIANRADAEKAIQTFDNQRLECNGVSMIMRVRMIGAVVNVNNPQSTPANGLHMAAMDNPK